MQLIIVAAGAAVVGALLGSAWTGNAKDAVIARLERDQARQTAAAADAASVRLYEAQHRSDALTTDLHAALGAARQLQQGLDDAIARTTDGRACLREPALRLLDGAPGLHVAGLPTPGRGAAGADAARVATDTDLGRWAAATGRQYDECRRRLDALIDWHEAG
jgi:hypothetical protein